MSTPRAGILTAALLSALTAAAAQESVQNAPALETNAAWLQKQMDTGFPLSGEYRLVSERRASGVAAPLAPDPSTVEPPRSVTFGLTLRWLDGAVCADWLPARWHGIPFDMGDPNLSDVTIGPLGDRPDRRSYWLFQIVCEGDVIGSLVVVDVTTAIIPSPNGASFAIVSLPPSENRVRRIQDRLRAGQFYVGYSTGVYDETTRAAVAAYAEHRGAAYRFANPAMSLNLLEGLGVWDGGAAP
jgi:hypothetical protein